MSDSLHRRLSRVEADLAARRPTADNLLWAAYDRIMDGSADWADHVLLSYHRVDGWRSRLRAKLPLALGCPEAFQSTRPIPYADRPLPVLLTSPGHALSAGQQALIAEVNSMWAQARTLSERVGWGEARLTLGADDGLAFREECWRVDDGVAVLSEQVLKDAHTWSSACHSTAQTIGFGNVRRLADQIIGPEVDRRFPEEAGKLRMWGLHRYLDVSLLEAPLLLAGVAGSPWFGEAGRSWWLGQNRSDPVTSTDDAAATEVTELVQEQLRRGAVSRIQAEMAQPKPWQTEDWHALQAAKEAGWEVEQEVLLAQSERHASRSALLPHS